MNILAIDVGGTNLKILATGQEQRRKVPSGPNMTAERMVSEVRRLAKDWKYDVESLGYPGRCMRVGPLRNLTIWQRDGSILTLKEHSGALSGSSTTRPCRRSAPTRKERCFSWVWALASVRARS